MTNDKYPQPPVAPGFNPLKEFEEKVAAHLDKDPRTDSEAMQKSLEMFPTSNLIELAMGEEEQERKEEIASIVGEFPGDEEDKEDEEEKEEDKEEDKEKAATKYIDSYQDLQNLLLDHGVDPEEALVSLLRNLPTKDKETDREIWRRDVIQVGMEIEEINEIIEQFLQTGNLKERFSFYDGRFQVIYRSMPQWKEDWCFTTLGKERARASEGWTRELEANTSLRCRIAGSLEHYQGPSGEILEPKDEKELTALYRVISRHLSSVEYRLLSDSLNAFELKLYLASQKISIENF